MRCFLFMNKNNFLFMGCMLMALLAFYAYTPFTLNSADVSINNTTSLQENINNASPGDTLLLDPGTYNATNVNITKNLTIKAAGPGVVLGNDGNSTALNGAVKGINVSIVGINIQNCTKGFTNYVNWSNQYGNITLENCTFSNNTNNNSKTTFGVQIYVGSVDMAIVVRNCTFENSGIPIYCSGSNNVNPNVTVESCTVKNNFKSLNGDTASGIEFSCLNNSIIRNCTINNITFNYPNSLLQNTGGAGIRLYGCGGVTVDNCVVDNNSALGSRAAMGGIGIVNCTNTLINNSMIRNNTAPYAGGIGVGDQVKSSYELLNSSRNVTINNCSITSNVATNMSGDNAGGVGFNAINGTITNCLIANNTAPDGGGVSLCNGNLINCSVINNSANYYSGVALRGGTNNTVSGCIIKNNHGANSIYVNAFNFSISTCDISNNLYNGIFGGVSVTNTSSGSIHFNHFFNNSFNAVFDLNFIDGNNSNVDYDENWWSGIDPFNSLMLSINEFLRF
jgi:hypothetical protein